MSIIALRAWYIQDYEPITELEKRPPDIRLSKKSLLKSGLKIVPKLKHQFGLGAIWKEKILNSILRVVVVIV
jgi:hypothetical protein